VKKVIRYAFKAVTKKNVMYFHGVAQCFDEETPVPTERIYGDSSFLKKVSKTCV
jgi:hypothetical protein